MKNLIVSRNPAARRSAKQKAASKRNIKKAQAARRKGTRRRTTTRKRRTKRRRSNPAATRRTYYRRSNPRRRMPSINSIINNQVMPAIVGGTGAVANDMLVNLLPLPAQFKSGWMRHISKAVGAVAIGILGGFVLTKRTADQLGAGAMTVVGYNVVRDLAAQFVPQLPLGEYVTPLGEYLPLGYYGAGMDPSLGVVPGSGMETAGQFTRGTPYLGGVGAWPTGGTYEDLDY